MKGYGWTADFHWEKRTMCLLQCLALARCLLPWMMFLARHEEMWVASSYVICFPQQNGPIFISPKLKVTKVHMAINILNTSKKPNFEFGSDQLDLNQLVALHFFPLCLESKPSSPLLSSSSSNNLANMPWQRDALPAERLPNHLNNKFFRQVAGFSMPGLVCMTACIVYANVSVYARWA